MLSPPRNIPAGYYHHGISLQVITTTGYPFRLLTPRDIIAGYYHHGISLQVISHHGISKRNQINE